MMVLDCMGREFSILVAEHQASISVEAMLAEHPDRKVKVLARLHELLLTLTQKQCIHSKLGALSTVAQF
jgi:hypothetical protein